MAIPADMIRLAVTALVSALVGGLAGYALAWHRLRRARVNLIQSRQSHRRDRLAWHRERYQDSTSRIHRPSESAPGMEDMPNEALEQLRLEMTILREDHRIETQLLRDENEELRDAVERARTTEATFTDIAEDAVTEEPIPVESYDEAPADVIEPEVEEPQIEEAMTEEPVAEEALIEEALTEEPVADESHLERQEEAPSRPERNIPEDIQALFLASAIREKLVQKQQAVEDDVDSADQSDETADAVPEAAHSSTQEDNESAPLTSTPPQAQDADGFHFHWEAPRPPSMPRKRHAPETPRLDMPAFRSLYDMLQASGVSLSPDTAATPVHQDMDPVHRIVGLDRESYALLMDLGYASLEQLAGLSEAETRRLAAVFRISPDRIRHEWTPSAQAELHGIRHSKGN